MRILRAIAAFPDQHTRRWQFRVKNTLISRAGIKGKKPAGEKHFALAEMLFDAFIIYVSTFFLVNLPAIRIRFLSFFGKAAFGKGCTADLQGGALLFMCLWFA